MIGPLAVSVQKSHTVLGNEAEWRDYEDPEEARTGRRIQGSDIPPGKTRGLFDRLQKIDGNVLGLGGMLYRTRSTSMLRLPITLNVLTVLALSLAPAQAQNLN